MAYTPNNSTVYLQAFSGAVAGLLGQSTPLTTTRGQYTDTIDIAGAWAQAFDTEWGVATNPDAFEAAEILTFSNDLFQVLEPQPNTGTTGAGSSTNPTTYTATAAALMEVLTEAETYLAASATIGNLYNKGWMNDQTTTNGQGVGGPTTVAIVQATARGSGIFRFNAAAAQAAAAAAEVVTWDVSYEEGTGVVTATGGTAATLGGKSSGEVLYASAAAGTGIVITAGGGTNEQLASEATTIGTAAVGSDFAAGGLFWNNVTNLPFAAGTNVILKLRITNSATNRVVSSINVALEEI
jgi:hypothetical protein